MLSETKTVYAALQFNVNDLPARRAELERNGFVFLADALPPGYCETIATFIDKHLDIDAGIHESGHMGSMQRIWSAENYADIVSDYKDKCAQILSLIFGSELQPQKILAMRDQAISFRSADERVRFERDRWHYDSWNDQYKIFLFLKDVNTDNGPFEFIPGTNGAFKRRLAMTRPWWFFNPLTHFFTTRRPYQCISDQRIQSVIDNGHPSVLLTAKQGSMLIVNPSALLHRASPIERGRRYLSVAYF